MKKVLMLLVVCIAILCCCGCRKTSLATYHFHFYVDGGNGKIQVADSSPFKDNILSCKEHNIYFDFTCVEGSNFNFINGGSNGYREQTFIAIPDEGYKVKEWIFNGKVVEGNTSESFVAKVTSEDGYHGMIIVKFEKVTDSK